MAVILLASCARTNVAEYAAAMDEFCRERGFNGAILVAERGKVIFSGGYGFADFQAGSPNTTETVFKLASVTKPITALCVLQLRDRGLLALDDPISKYLPDYPDGSSIRIIHLLSHTSGIPEYATVAFLGRADRPYASEELLRHFRDKKPRFTPGTAFEYSNSNYIALGLIIESVSGMTYGDFVAKNVFGPVGMDSSRYGAVAGLATGYLRLAADGGIAAFPIDLSSMYSSGGLVSTVEDLYKLDRALGGEALLRRASKSLMSTAAFEFSDYGLGWRIEKAGRKPVVQHSGSINGGAGHLYRDTGQDRTIIILSNVQNADLTSIRNKALELFKSAR